MDKVDKIRDKKKRYLNEVLLTTKRLQSTIEHSKIILKQVQAKYPMSSEHAGKASELGEKLRESDIIVKVRRVLFLCGLGVWD
jgi:hypothetical protein